jgi:hypothetical protein
LEKGWTRTELWENSWLNKKSLLKISKIKRLFEKSNARMLRKTGEVINGWLQKSRVLYSFLEESSCGTKKRIEI